MQDQAVDRLGAPIDGETIREVTREVFARSEFQPVEPSWLEELLAPLSDMLSSSGVLGESAQIVL